MKLRKLIWLLAGVLSFGCAPRPGQDAGQGSHMEYARWFDLLPNGAILLRSPSGQADTLAGGPWKRLACMSSSYVGFLDAIGMDSCVVAVSGRTYLGNPRVRERAAEIGYDAALDYETLVRLHPDLLITYLVSDAEPPYIAKLRSLGIPVIVLYEHVESHPLARAEYIKLFGALTGATREATRVFEQVRDQYMALAAGQARTRVLMNIPYADAWYIPGGDNYMTRLIADAGGIVLGAVPGRTSSSIVSVETAYAYARQADVWLHPGWAGTRAQLRSIHPLFGDFPVMEKAIWNNTKQVTPEGGNLFWESGPVRPDLILSDLTAIFHGQTDSVDLHYYVPVL